MPEDLPSAERLRVLAQRGLDSLGARRHFHRAPFHTWSFFKQAAAVEEWLVAVLEFATCPGWLRALETRAADLFDATPKKQVQQLPQPTPTQAESTGHAEAAEAATEAVEEPSGAGAGTDDLCQVQRVLTCIVDYDAKQPVWGALL